MSTPKNDDRQPVAVFNGREAGRIRRAGGGRLTFVCREGWRQADVAYPRPMSVPVTAAAHGHKAVAAVLSGLPAGKAGVLQRWARRFQVSPPNTLALMRDVGDGIVRLIAITGLVLACTRAAAGAEMRPQAGPTTSGAVIYPLGSQIGLVPPPGFVAAKNLPGFEHADTRSQIVMAELPGNGYPEMEKLISGLKGQGVVVEEKRENLRLPGNARGLLVVTDIDTELDKVRRWMLLEQLPDAIALVSVVVPRAALRTVTDDMVRASLGTLTVRPLIPLGEQLQLLPFTITDMSGLHPVRVTGYNGVILTYGDQATAAAAEQPYFSIQVAPGPEHEGDRDDYARTLFTRPGPDVRDVNILSAEILKLGNGGTQPTHETQAEAKDASGTPLKIVQWVRFGNNGSAIRMLGIARADQWPAALARFRAVRDGIVPTGP